MRALICGGRDFSDEARFLRLMDAMNEQYGPFEAIIQGGARGADSFAGAFAVDQHIPLEIFRPDWGRLGRAAGPIRNEQMLREGHPDIVFAFPGGRGTASMIALARAAGVRVVEFT